jgi:glutathione S-transferase
MSTWRASDEDDGGGEEALMADLAQGDHPPFAPPYLVDGDLVIGQTANILLHLGLRHGLAPKAEAGGCGSTSCS